MEPLEGNWIFRGIGSGRGLQQEVALREQIIKLLAARRFYGLGTPIDQRAAALILARSWESDTRRFDVAFAVSELTDADLLELSRVWESNWR